MVLAVGVGEKVARQRRQADAAWSGALMMAGSRDRSNGSRCGVGSGSRRVIVAPFLSDIAPNGVEIFRQSGELDLRIEGGVAVDLAMIR